MNFVIVFLIVGLIGLLCLFFVYQYYVKGRAGDKDDPISVSPTVRPRDSVEIQKEVQEEDEEVEETLIPSVVGEDTEDEGEKLVLGDGVSAKAETTEDEVSLSTTGNEGLIVSSIGDFEEEGEEVEELEELMDKKIIEDDLEKFIDEISSQVEKDTKSPPDSSKERSKTDTSQAVVEVVEEIIQGVETIVTKGNDDKDPEKGDKIVNKEDKISPDSDEPETLEKVKITEKKKPKSVDPLTRMLDTSLWKKYDHPSSLIFLSHPENWLVETHIVHELPSIIYTLLPTPTPSREEKTEPISDITTDHPKLNITLQLDYHPAFTNQETQTVHVLKSRKWKEVRPIVVNHLMGQTYFLSDDDEYYVSKSEDGKTSEEYQSTQIITIVPSVYQSSYCLSIHLNNCEKKPIPDHIHQLFDLIVSNITLNKYCGGFSNFFDPPKGDQELSQFSEIIYCHEGRFTIRLPSFKFKKTKADDCVFCFSHRSTILSSTKEEEDPNTPTSTSSSFTSSLQRKKKLNMMIVLKKVKISQIKDILGLASDKSKKKKSVSQQISSISVGNRTYPLTLNLFRDNWYVYQLPFVFLVDETPQTENEKNEEIVAAEEETTDDQDLKKKKKRKEGYLLLFRHHRKPNGPKHKKIVRVISSLRVSTSNIMNKTEQQENQQFRTIIWKNVKMGLMMNLSCQHVQQIEEFPMVKNLILRFTHIVQSEEDGGEGEEKSATKRKVYFSKMSTFKLDPLDNEIYDEEDLSMQKICEKFVIQSKDRKIEKSNLKTIEEYNLKWKNREFGESVPKDNLRRKIEAIQGMILLEKKFEKKEFVTLILDQRRMRVVYIRSVFDVKDKISREVVKFHDSVILL